MEPKCSLPCANKWSTKRSLCRPSSVFWMIWIAPVVTLFYMSLPGRVWPAYTRAVWKVRGLTLSLWVGTLWRCGDGFFEVLPLASDALLTTLHPLRQNVLQTVDHFQIYCLGAPFSWLEKPRNRMGRDVDCMADVLMGFHRSTFSKANTKFNSDLTPMLFMGFSNHKKVVPRQKISKWSTVYSTFSRSGWSVVRSASLSKGGTSKKRPSPHLHKVPTRSNKMSPRTLKRPSYYRNINEKYSNLQQISPPLSVQCIPTV
jgi:hypothetical protein